MSASAHHVRLVPASRPSAGGSGRRAYLAAVAAVAVATLVAIAASLSSRASGVRALPPEERAALLSRTVDELRQFCGAGHAAALDDHCRELASFAAQFRECRGECEALVRPLLTPTPMR